MFLHVLQRLGVGLSSSHHWNFDIFDARKGLIHKFGSCVPTSDTKQSTRLCLWCLCLNKLYYFLFSAIISSRFQVWMRMRMRMRMMLLLVMTMTMTMTRTLLGDKHCFHMLSQETTKMATGLNHWADFRPVLGDGALIPMVTSISTNCHLAWSKIAEDLCHRQKWYRWTKGLWMIMEHKHNNSCNCNRRYRRPSVSGACVGVNCFILTWFRWLRILRHFCRTQELVPSSIHFVTSEKASSTVLCWRWKIDKIRLFEDKEVHLQSLWTTLDTCARHDLISHQEQHLGWNMMKLFNHIQ